MYCTFVVVAGVPIQAHRVLSVVLPRLETEDHKEASTLFVVTALARFFLRFWPSISVIHVMSVLTVTVDVLVALSVMTSVTAGSVMALVAAPPDTVCVMAGAVVVEVIVAAVEVTVTGGRGKALEQKVCAGANEESSRAALYGWLEHAGRLDAEDAVTSVKARDEP